MLVTVLARFLSLKWYLHGLIVRGDALQRLIVCEVF